VMVVTGTILSGMEGFINRMGNTTDAMGIYFIARFLLAEPDDIKSLIKGMAIILLPLGFLMLIEMKTGRNFFSDFGGVPEITVVRHGKLRCQGAFAHPILAGTAGAVSFPFMVYFILTKTSRVIGIIGVISTLAMVVTSNSSGPIMTLFFGIVGLFFWRWRFKMKIVRIFILLTLVGLNFVMKSPVWYLLAKIDLTGSSTGWHRAELINSALIHLQEWWLVGTNYTRHWMPTGVSWSPDHTDITNHYLHFGVIGGLPTMVCFIMMIVKGFRLIGILIRKEYLEKEEHLLFWTAGSILFAHVMTFFSVSYFDQTSVFLYTLFAIIGSLFNTYSQKEFYYSTDEVKEEKYDG
ncbi:MAG: O-antigen ligase family protein, partial [Chitinispirillaceae bacterium]|nr:O-antigen ligase family protein [Chitinispirillaceae bacterium]